MWIDTIKSTFPVSILEQFENLQTGKSTSTSKRYQQYDQERAEESWCVHAQAVEQRMHAAHAGHDPCRLQEVEQRVLLVEIGLASGCTLSAESVGGHRKSEAADGKRLQREGHVLRGEEGGRAAPGRRERVEVAVAQLT